MSITIVQKAHALLPNGNGSIAFPNRTTAGNSVIMVWAWGSITGGAFTFSDDAGNNILSTNPRNFNGSNANNGSIGSECWITVIENPDSQSNFCRPMQTVTASMGVSVSVAFWLFEISVLHQVSFPTLYASQVFTQNTSWNQPTGQIQTLSPLAPYGTSDPFYYARGTSDSS